jgi:hypothetical protein
MTPCIGCLAPAVDGDELCRKCREWSLLRCAVERFAAARRRPASDRASSRLARRVRQLEDTFGAEGIE